MNHSFEKIPFPPFPENPIFEELFFSFVEADAQIAAIISSGQHDLSLEKTRELSNIVTQVSKIDHACRVYCNILISHAREAGLILNINKE